MDRTHSPSHHGSFLLTRRGIYIFPTRYGFGFAGVLSIMLLGSINYNNNMGFMLTFMLGGMTLVSIFHTYRNMAGLRIDIDRAEPIFAGESALFCLQFDNRRALTRYSLYLSRLPRSQEYSNFRPIDIHLPADRRTRACLETPILRRGLAPLGQLMLETNFPLGLFRAWTYLYPDVDVLVYPHPAGEQPLPVGAPQDNERGLQPSKRGDDFIGYRAYMQNDSHQHVDWKIVARDKGWFVKQFGGESDSIIWLTWESAMYHQNQEKALSQLCRWVIQAENAGLSYGVILPGVTLSPANGLAHYRQCLEALALFDT